MMESFNTYRDSETCVFQKSPSAVSQSSPKALTYRCWETSAVNSPSVDIIALATLIWCPSFASLNDFEMESYLGLGQCLWALPQRPDEVTDSERFQDCFGNVCVAAWSLSESGKQEKKKRKKKDLGLKLGVLDGSQCGFCQKAAVCAGNGSQTHKGRSLPRESGPSGRHGSGEERRGGGF